jgi:hypothetical protein
MVGEVYKEVDDARYFLEGQRYHDSRCMGGCGRRLVAKGTAKEEECVVTSNRPAYGCVNETTHNCLHVVCGQCFLRGMKEGGEGEEGRARRTRRNR